MVESAKKTIKKEQKQPADLFESLGALDLIGLREISHDLHAIWVVFLTQPMDPEKKTRLNGDFFPY